MEQIQEHLVSKAGSVAKQDAEYVRNGTANIVMACEPLAGQRHCEFTDTRKRKDGAVFIKELLIGP